MGSSITSRIGYDSNITSGSRMDLDSNITSRMNQDGHQHYQQIKMASNITSRTD